MPFISNRKRQSLIRNVNTKYTFRKICMVISFSLLIVFIISVLSIALGWVLGFNKTHSEGLTEQQTWIKMCEHWWSPFVISNPEAIKQGQPIKISLSWISYVEIVLFIIALAGGIASIVFAFTIKSPKDVKDDIKTLESSPLPGKSIKRLSPVEVVQQRRQIPLEQPEKGSKKE